MRTRPAGRLAREQAPATERLHARLARPDLDELEARLRASDERIELPVTPGAEPRRPLLRELWEGAQPPERERLSLAFGLHLGVPGFAERTGLPAALPPGDVHAMTRSPLAAGGSYYHADLVVDALASVGSELAAGARVLDFGCSSGRVVGVLAVAFGEVEWHGCDPIERSVEWGRATWPGVEFASQPERPPLRYDDDSFDLVYAISVWSHFAERPALAWFEEMRRVLRPGGALVFTTHGLQSCSYYGERLMRSTRSLIEIRSALYDRGFWFAPESGGIEEWGLEDPEWGMAFMTAEWVVEHLCPAWRVAEFAAGRNEENQDVYVLERA
ncbi:MAG: methyltransferase domain-containing protein [Thermoleophilaceae bacterium]